MNYVELREYIAVLYMCECQYITDFIYDHATSKVVNEMISDNQ